MVYDGLKLLAETICDGMSLLFGIDFCVVVNIDVKDTSDDGTVDHEGNSCDSFVVDRYASLDITGNFESSHRVAVLYIAQVVKS